MVQPLLFEPTGGSYEKTLFLTIVLVLDCLSLAMVDPYMRREGTYVGGHYRKQSPDDNPYKSGRIPGFLLIVALPKRSKVIDLIQPLHES
jgi:hypothetical protein